MRGVVDGDDGAVKRLVGQQLANVVVGPANAVTLGGGGEGLRVAVAEGDKLGIGVLDHAGNVRIGRPPPRPDDRDARFLCHIAPTCVCSRAEPFVWC